MILDHRAKSRFRIQARLADSEALYHDTCPDVVLISHLPRCGTHKSTECQRVDLRMKDRRCRPEASHMCKS